MSVIPESYRTLQKLWSQPNPDTSAVNKQLQKLKDDLDKQKTIPVDSNVVNIFKDYYEIRALNVINGSDMNAFEAAVSDAIGFYSCNSVDTKNKYLIYGLYLMHLLASNRISEFHTFIEQIDHRSQAENAFINFPVRLEKHLMEGAYNKVLEDEKSQPSPHYSVFVKILKDTIRNEIGNCYEKAYTSIPAKELYKVLFFDNQKDYATFVEKRSWRTNKNIVFFNNPLIEEEMMNVEGGRPPKSNTLENECRDVIEKNIYYAKRLEMIV